MRKVGSSILGEDRKEDVVMKDFTEIMLFGESKLFSLAMMQVAQICLWLLLMLSTIGSLIGAIRAYRFPKQDKKIAQKICYNILTVSGKKIPYKLEKEIRKNSKYL
jgi:hypothetical protein